MTHLPVCGHPFVGALNSLSPIPMGTLRVDLFCIHSFMCQALFSMPVMPPNKQNQTNIPAFRGPTFW